MAFDVRGEDAGRGAGGTLPDPSRIDDVNTGAAGSELVGNGAPDHAGANDRDLHRGIVPGSRLALDESSEQDPPYVPTSDSPAERRPSASEHRGGTSGSQGF